MRQGEKEALLVQLHEISAQVSASVKYTASKDSLAVQFCLGMVTAYLNRLEANIVNAETDPDEGDCRLPQERPANRAAYDLFSEKEGWREVLETSEDVAGSAAAEQEAKDTEDVVLRGPEEEQPAAGAKARVKVSNLPKVSALPPTKEVRVPDEELQKPKTLALDEDLPDPIG